YHLRIAIDPVHHRRIAHAAHHVGQMFAVANFDREYQGRSVLIALLVLDVFDVRIAFGDRCGDGREHTGSVVDDDAQARAVVARDFAVPVDRDDALGLLAVL